MRCLITIGAILAALAGCGGTAGPPTTTLGEGTMVDAERYLADSAAGAAAVRSFNSELAAVGSPATPERLRSVAPRLELPFASARLAAQRLAAARLDDQRLESQRSRDAASFAAAVAAMERVLGAAAAGNPAATKAAATDLEASLNALRETATPSP